MEKKELMGKLFRSETLDMIGRLKTLFDPECRLNPGKVLPTGRGCMEIRQPALTAIKRHAVRSIEASEEIGEEGAPFRPFAMA